LAAVSLIFEATTVKFGLKVRTSESLSPKPNFVKISLGDWPLRDRLITRNSYFDDFGGLKPFSKGTMVNLTQACGHGTPFPTPNFVEIGQGD